MKLKKGSAEAKAYMAKIRAKKSTKKVAAKKVSGYKKPTTTNKNKMGATYYYGEGKQVSPLNLKIGEVYEWIVGAEYLEVEYIGLTKNFPQYSKTFLTYGDGKYLFQFTKDKSFVKLSMTAVRDVLRTIPKVGSTLKLKANEKRLGATAKDVKTRSKNYHKDTKSHNVRISVISGLGSIDTLHKEIKAAADIVEGLQYAIESNNKRLKTAPSTYEKNKIKKDTAFFKSKLAYYKKALIQLKKLYNKK